MGADWRRPTPRRSWSAQSGNLAPLPPTHNEIQGSWTLYKSGVLREAYATEIPTRVVFVIEADNTAAAERHLALLAETM
jgi:hypothetical protein